MISRKLTHRDEMPMTAELRKHEDRTTVKIQRIAKHWHMLAQNDGLAAGHDQTGNHGQRRQDNADAQHGTLANSQSCYELLLAAIAATVAVNTMIAPAKLNIANQLVRGSELAPAPQPCIVQQE